MIVGILLRSEMEQHRAECRTEVPGAAPGQQLQAGQAGDAGQPHCQGTAAGPW